jgi:hypothetical protein
MTDLLPPSFCWHCLHYLEWTSIAVIWDNSGVGHDTVPDFLMTTMMTATGIGYNSPRFLQLMETYGWTLVNTPAPPPLDWVWTTSKPMWWEIGEQYEAEADADWNLCEPFIGAWFKGAGWPDLG